MPKEFTMPTVEEQALVWEAVQAKNFTKVGELIESNLNLIHSLHPRHKTNGRNLPIQLIQQTTNTKTKPAKLLISILTNPEMDWDFKLKKETAVTSIFDALSVDKDTSILEALQFTPGFIWNTHGFVYEVAIQRLKELEDYLQKCIEKQKSQEDIEEAQADIVAWKKDMVHVRDVVILFAIHNDRDDIFEYLKKLGDKPLRLLGKLGGERLPRELINKDSHPKLNSLCEKDTADLKLKAERDRVSVKAHIESSKAMQARFNKANDDCDQKGINVLQKEQEEREVRMHTAGNAR